jgi:hypothetical protein
VDALIDDALNLVDDALNLNRQTVEQASSIGAPHEITVTLPVNALPDISVITVTVLSTNELAIGETPPPGTGLIRGTAYVISITNALGPTRSPNSTRQSRCRSRSQLARTPSR